MRPSFSIVILGFGFVIGCSGADTSTKGAGGSAPNDGKLHPPPNGMPIASTDACTKLNAAVSSKEQSFNPFCTVTHTLCPGADALSCKDFDDGTVTGCAEYYQSATTCKDLGTYAAGCDVACKD